LDQFHPGRGCGIGESQVNRRLARGKPDWRANGEELAPLVAEQRAEVRQSGIEILYDDAEVELIR
jgi:hypothetical protein